MIRLIATTLVFSTAAFGAALAQQAPNNSSTMPPAIATGSAESKTAAAPVPGANSFTEAEARDRLIAHGYNKITDLKKDEQSIWRGKAMKDSKPVDVALDYQGNIVNR